MAQALERLPCPLLLQNITEKVIEKRMMKIKENKSERVPGKSRNGKPQNVIATC